MFNRLTRSNAPAEDRLFATLDSRLRKGYLGRSTTALFVDTVGFIRKLPHHLVASFRSTLEDIVNAHLVLHVVDGSHPRWRDHKAVGEEVLADLGVDLDRVWTVLNKADREMADPSRANGAVSLSARTGDGMEELKARLLERVAIGTRAGCR